MKIPIYKPKTAVKEVVDLFIANNRVARKKEIQFYKNQKTLGEAIKAAALSENLNGKRHSHQRRIPFLVLHDASEKLLAKQNKLKGCCNFDQLFGIIEKTVGNIYGIGELTVYDITNRIGSFLGLRPEYIYLHAGTRVGCTEIVFT